QSGLSSLKVIYYSAQLFSPDFFNDASIPAAAVS
ncbi:sugar-binding protein, partial [Shigella boydii]